MSLQTLRSLARKHGLTRVVPQLAPLLRNEILVKINPANKTLRVGASKVGGQPDLPPEVRWPLPDDLEDDDPYDGDPLPFVAQFDLAEVRPFDVDKLLPRSGMLYVFHAVPEEWEPSQTRVRVLYTEAKSGDLVRRAFPKKLAARLRYRECRVAFGKRAVLPPTSSIFGKKLKLTEEEDDAYFDFVDTFSRAQDKRLVSMTLLGYPRAMQDDTIEEDCQLTANGVEPYSEGKKAKALRAKANIWRQLLGFGTDEDARISLGFARAYIMLREADLAARNFVAAWSAFQST